MFSHWQCRKGDCDINISIIGSGYVGLITAVGFAVNSHNVRIEEGLEAFVQWYRNWGYLSGPLNCYWLNN